jgi:hypothetical protein
MKEVEEMRDKKEERGEKRREEERGSWRGHGLKNERASLMDDEKYIVIRSISQKRWGTCWRGESLNTKGTRDHEGRAEEEGLNTTGTE